MGMQTSKERVLAIKVRDLKQERKELQLELTLEQLCDAEKRISGNFVNQGKTHQHHDVVWQLSTANRKRILEIQARLNNIFRELFTLQQEQNKLVKSPKLRPVLRWGKFLADVELHWI